MARNKYNSLLKNNIISDYNKGLPQKDISKKYSICKSVISRIIKRFHLNGTVETVHYGGRPRKTSQRTDQKIIREIKKNPFISSTELVRELSLNVSARTIRRRAVTAGLCARKPSKKPFISRKNRLARLAFAKAHVGWNASQWRNILFSDESKFNIKGSDMKNFTVRRPINTRLKPEYCRGTVKHGGGSVMVWGCFSYSGIGPICQITEKMDRFLYKNILENEMLPYADENMPLIWVFQHDNDPKHTSKVVSEWLKASNVRVLQWPAQSPDLNPIENLWSIVDRQIKRDKETNKYNIFHRLKDAWNSISQDQIERLIDSMPRRCTAVIKNNGYAIDY